MIFYLISKGGLVKHRILIILLIFFLVQGIFAEPAGSWEFHAEMDMYLSIKAGAEYHFTDTFGLRGSLGFLVIGPSQISYTLVGIHHLMPAEKSFQMDLQYGLIQAVFDVIAPETVPYSYWIIGACAAFGYRGHRGHCFRLRAGGGVSIGYDMGKWQSLFLMPNIALEYGYRF